MKLDVPEIEELRRQMEILMDYVQLVTETGGKLTVNLSDIAHKEGVNVSQLRKGSKDRYLLPRYGESGYPTGRTRWDTMEYARWRHIPPEERRRGYLEHLRSEVRRKRKEKANR